MSYNILSCYGCKKTCDKQKNRNHCDECIIYKCNYIKAYVEKCDDHLKESICINCYKIVNNIYKDCGGNPLDDEITKSL